MPGLASTCASHARDQASSTILTDQSIPAPASIVPLTSIYLARILTSRARIALLSLAIAVLLP